MSDERLYKGVNCSELFWEYPFFKDGMTITEFQNEQEKYFDYIKKGGEPRNYVQRLNNK